jgi:hypothetical protein
MSDMPDSTLLKILLLTLLLSLLALAFEIGFRLGRRAGPNPIDPGGTQLGAIQGAILGLLGLLLAFSFSGAASRFIERQDLILQESNAIGTAYLRADLLDEPYASQVRRALAEYVRDRIQATRAFDKGVSPETAARVSDLHNRLWSAARDGSRAKPETQRVVLDPVNQVIDLHSTRVAAAQKHLPGLVLTLLVLSSLLAMSVIGYGCGPANRRNLPMTASLALLIAAALWTTVDLDYPRAGFIRLNDAPLEQLNLQPTP